MEYVVCGLVALLGSGLTLFSGFGLGTLLTPVFGLFFPIEVAIALTAIVHFLNNMFKLVLVGKQLDKATFIRFGLPSILAALLGAFLLNQVSHWGVIAQYTLGEKICTLTPVKLLIAWLLIGFAGLELIPKWNQRTFDKKWLPLGGVLSGFFGGLSGNQGALRTAFLSRAGLSKEAFIGTGVVIACCIDVSRLSVYSSQILKTWGQLDMGLLLTSTLCAFAGAYLGSKLLKKITIKTVQWMVTLMLMVFAVLLGSGIL